MPSSVIAPSTASDQRVGVAGTDILGRSAVPRQIQCNRAATVRQRRLREHPAVEVGTEAVQQQGRHGIAAANLQIAQSLAGNFQFARRHRVRRVRRFIRPFDDDEAGDEFVDLRRGRVRRREHGEQRADRQGRALRRHDATQRAVRIGLDDVGDLGSLDLQDLVTLGKCGALGFQPLHHLPLGHGQTPFGHGDRGDRRAHRAYPWTSRTAAAMRSGSGM